MRLDRFIACVLVAATGLMASHGSAQVVINTAQTTPEVISSGDALTVTETGSVIVSNDSAVEFDTTDVSGDILIDGTVESNSSSDTDQGINITGVGVDGSITINGTVKAATGDAIDIQAFGKTFTGSIINNGTLEGGDGPLNVSGLEFEGGVLQGSIINSATGLITTSGDNGIKIDGDLDSDLTDNEGVIEGQVVNNGTITAVCEALDIDSNAWIKSGIVNTGTLQNTDTSGDCSLIEVDEASRVDGGITNSGLMKSSEGDVIYVYRSTVTGDIVNNKTIEANGSSGDGILFEESTLEGDIINNDTIDADSEGIKIRSGSVMTGDIVNNKTITAGDSGIELRSSGTRLVGDIVNAFGASITATSGDGIRIDSDGALEGKLINRGTISSLGGEAYDLDGRASITGGIINSGTLRALDDEAIEIDEDFRIDGGFNNSGLIESDDDVIEIENGSTLNGGLTNSGQIRSNSDTDFSDAIELRVDSTLNGGLTNTGLIAAPNRAIQFSSSSTMTGSLDNQSGGVIIGRVEIETSVDMINGGRWYMKLSADFDNPSQTGSVGEMSTLDGTYTQTSSGLLGIASDASGFSQLSVDGDVNFASGTKIQVDVKNNGQHLAVGDRLENVVQATGTLTAGSFSIIDNSSEFDFIAETDTNSLTLVIVDQPLAVPTLSTLGLALLVLMMLALASVMLTRTRLN